MSRWWSFGMNGLSLFAGAGIGEYFLDKAGVNIVVANELINKRAELYKKFYPNAKMICGDISDKTIFDEVAWYAKKNNVEFIIASPPCQGISIAGKNRAISEMARDKRNYLINYSIKMIKEVEPKYVLIENVPLLLKLRLYSDGNYVTIHEILNKELGDEYDIDANVLDASDYGVPQIRKRAIIRLKLKKLHWTLPPKKNKKKTVRDAIGDLKSLESNEISDQKWHYGRKHCPQHIVWMKHTPTGMSAFDNEFFYPKKKDGSRVKGYNSSYRRIKWDEPAPTITIRNDAISSQRNVHPGYLKEDGTYSDARVLSILELMRLTSLPDDWPIPEGTPEILIRQIIGESIPPLFVQKIVEGIKNEN